MDKLCGGMKADIEGGIHSMPLLWQKNYQEEDCGLLLIDAQNLFNEENWKAMLWAVRFDWTSGTQFTFNRYCHWVTLVVLNVDGSGHLLHSKGGRTQGYLLVIIDYGIGILPIIRELRDAHPYATQPCYADYDGTGGELEALQDNMQDMMVRGNT